MNKLSTYTKEFMRTTITFKIVKSNVQTVQVQNAVEEGFGEFDRIVKKFTRFNQNSELSNLNRQSGIWVQVGEEFFMLIETMLEISEQSKGAFDPTVIDFLEAYGYDPNYDFSKLDNPELDELVKKIANERPSWKEIELDRKNRKVRLAKNQRIDLGGIGKGYAIDCARKKFTDNGLENFLIDAGGDILAQGKNEKKQKWTAALKVLSSEGIPEEVGILELENEALACSGSWARKVKQFHHIINPQTGKPDDTHSTVFVKAATATTADAWATAIFVNKDPRLKVPKGISFLTF